MNRPTDEHPVDTLLTIYDRMGVRDLVDEDKVEKLRRHCDERTTKREART